MITKHHFHKKGFVLGLVLKQRHIGNGLLGKSSFILFEFCEGRVTLIQTLTKPLHVGQSLQMDPA